MKEATCGTDDVAVELGFWRVGEGGRRKSFERED
jgi:hypothetical protein